MKKEIIESSGQMEKVKPKNFIPESGVSYNVDPNNKLSQIVSKPQNPIPSHMSRQEFIDNHSDCNRVQSSQPYSLQNSMLNNDDISE